jgi:two-component system NtrC family sensor kinase
VRCSEAHWILLTGFDFFGARLKVRSSLVRGRVRSRIRRFTFSLSLKLAVCLTGAMIAVLSLVGYQLMRLHEENLQELTYLAAERIGDTVKSSTRYSMMRNHRDAVYHIIRTIGAEPGIDKIRIFNEQGAIRFSTADKEVETQVDKRAEACYACHTQEQPLTRLNRPDRMRVYTAKNGERILGLIVHIENGPDCSGAPCHAHPPDKQVLGVLDVTLSLNKVDAMMAESRDRMVVDLVEATLAVSLVFGLLIWYMIHRPLNVLKKGIQRVAEGDLEHKVTVSSSDETGQLAAAFNQMTAELNRAKADLTEWGRTLESRVEEKTAELRRAHQGMLQIERMASMGQLSAIVAHEINNPLAGILAYARLLSKRIQNRNITPETCATVQEDLDLIASEAARCGEIVKGLLQFARQSKKNYQPNDVNHLVSESLRLVKHKVTLMNVDARLQLDEAAPPVVCDAQEIRQALVAILINACEAIGPDEGALEVGTRFRAEANAVELWVKDNGVGMDEETQKRVFEPFFTTKEHGKGVGLGLAAVSGIVSQHSGEIVVESKPGAGTTVTIRLPLSSAAVPASETKATVI